MAILKTIKNESLSSDAVYTTRILDINGKIAADCNCPGWTRRVDPKDGSRSCKHTKHALASLVTDIKVEAGRRGLDLNGPAKATKADVAKAGDGFVSPMLASPLEAGFAPRPGEWAVEEKFNGHRAVVVVVDGIVTAFSRPRATDKARVLRRELPAAVEARFARLPNGTYDGELMAPAGHHSKVRDLATTGHYFVVFDVLMMAGVDLCGRSYDARREVLKQLALSGALGAANEGAVVRVARSEHADSIADVTRFAEEVWKRGGEGAILKRRAAAYQPGKRSKDFIKVKKVRLATLTVVGFEAGKMGPFAVVILEDADGVRTQVKTLNNAELRRFEKSENGDPIGRRLVIEYSERTADGAYENPRWDRWENE